MRGIHWAIIILILISFLIGIYLYPQMPDTIASHWNAKGEADGYMGKFWALFIIPIIATVILPLLIFIPRLDPLKGNIAKFRKEYDRFIFLITFFLFYLYILTLLWNLNIKFNLVQALAPAFSVLFYYTGILIEKTKRNWFIGIRTPWTLSSDRVWEKTHKLGGKLFRIAGIIAAFGLIFPDYAIILIIAPVLIFSAFSFVYSYLEYVKLGKS
ncbi:MAG: SdpI family protein [archaeon]